MSLKKVTSADAKRSRSFKDIDMSFLRNPVTDGLSTVQNENSIKQAVRNLISTGPNEKLYQPEIGSQVRKLLFEPMDAFTVELLRDEIINTISQYEQRVVLEDVAVSASEANNDVDVYISYRIVGIPLVEEISFVLKRP